jgi:type IV pilus assembly protein PilB
MASMDIAEKRKPQDGRIAFVASGREIDIRTSVLPGNHGETIVMRLLDKERNLLSLDALGFLGEDNKRFQRIIKRPNGIFLVTGPTGSGKTTTLYAALKQLNRPTSRSSPPRTRSSTTSPASTSATSRRDRPDVRADPPRDAAPGAEHHPGRRDPRQGDRRDRRAGALTGHLVFSTLHTNDAPSAITRLIDMGVKPFLCLRGRPSDHGPAPRARALPEVQGALRADADRAHQLGLDHQALGSVKLQRQSAAKRATVRLPGRIGSSSSWRWTRRCAR